MSLITSRKRNKCPICGSIKLSFCWQVSGYSLVQCKDCSLIFVKENPTQSELTDYYATVKDEFYQDSNLNCLTFYYSMLRKEILKHHPDVGRLLDVGCSGGWFLDVMRDWDCYGNEINQAYAKIAHQKYGINIAEGAFQDYPTKKEYFDVITLQDVLDHFADPIPVLQKCHSMLRPGGLIVIKVHNISCLYAKLAGARFYAIIPPSHLCYYDKNTLYQVLNNTGFQPVETKYMPHLLQLKTVFFRLSRGSTASIFYRLYSLLNKTKIGQIRIRKNLHDLITVFAIKVELATKEKVLD